MSKKCYSGSFQQIQSELDNLIQHAFGIVFKSISMVNNYNYVKGLLNKCILIPFKELFCTYII